MLSLLMHFRSKKKNWHQFKLLYAFPPFSMINNCLQKLNMTSTPGIFILPLWPTQPWFTRSLQMLVATPLLLPQRMDLLRLSNSPSCHPPAKKMRLMALKLSNSLTEQEAFRQATTSIILSSWRDGSRKQYSSYLKRWVQFCSQRQIDPLRAPVTRVLDFLTELYNTGLGYSAINMARSAIASILLSTGAVSFGSHPLVVRFLRGVYNLRPSLLWYTEIWDVCIVLDKLREMSPASTLALKELTYKLVMLIALVSAQRGQTIHLLNIKNMTKMESSYSFTITELTKTKKPGHKADIITLMAFTPDIRLCIYHCLEEYIQRTEKLRSDDGQLFISFNQATQQSQS